MYEISMDVDDNGYECRTTLKIKTEHGEETYYDGGEPEDNSFGRDWSWVPYELRRAYEKGLEDAKAIA